VLEGRTLFCSLPLARILETDELLAIVGHELGHFRGEDTMFSKRFYPIYRGTWASLFELSVAGRAAFLGVSLWPAIAVFSFFLERFALAENAHSRERELLADAAGASVTSASCMGTALVKLHAFAAIWSGVRDAAVSTMRNGRMFVNTSDIFAMAVASHAKPSSFEGIADRHTSHPTDSHPTLAVRLAALGVTVDEVAEAAMRIAPAAPASALVDDYNRYERMLSGPYQALLAMQNGIQLPAAPAEPLPSAGV
jgi:Zn-dependent protease with chaperone function